MGRKSKTKKNKGTSTNNNNKPPPPPQLEKIVEPVPVPQPSSSANDHNQNKVETMETIPEFNQPSPSKEPDNAEENQEQRIEQAEQEGNEEKEKIEQEEVEWCIHFENSNAKLLMRALKHHHNCMECNKPAEFSCIHPECLRKDQSNCCENLRHVMQHMTNKNHPALVHYEYEVITCTKCDAQISIEEFIHRHSVKIKKNRRASLKTETLQLKGVTGYVNYGNTCYLNSVLQLLGHCTPLVQYLLELTPPGGWGKCPKDVPKTVIQMAIDQRIMNSPLKRPFASPWNIISCIRIEMPEFECFQQQDASEFLRSLLDILDRDLKVCQDYYNKKRSVATGNPDADYLIALQDRTTKTVISSLFRGVLENQIRCHTCGYRSCTYENFLFAKKESEFFQDLSIPIVGENEFEDMFYKPTKKVRKKKRVVPPADESTSYYEGIDPGFLVNKGIKNKISLDECLDMFFENSVLCGENQYSCRKCERLVDATKTVKAKELPEIILIQLKRFRHTVYGCSKIGKIVEFPLRSQDFGEWTTNGESVVYDLVGFVVHVGRNIDCGHYVSFCLNEQENQWYHYDDSTVTRYDDTEVAKNEPYILMYRKRQDKNRSPADNQKTESPFNFFKVRHILNDKYSEAWDVIEKSFEENYKCNKIPLDEVPPAKQISPTDVAERKPKTVEENMRVFSKEQTAEILAKTDVSPEDLHQHVSGLEQILEDLTNMLLPKKRKKNGKNRTAKCPDGQKQASKVKNVRKEKQEERKSQLGKQELENETSDSAHPQLYDSQDTSRYKKSDDTRLLKKDSHTAPLAQKTAENAEKYLPEDLPQNKNSRKESKADTKQETAENNANQIKNATMTSLVTQTPVKTGPKRTDENLSPVKNSSGTRKSRRWEHDQTSATTSTTERAPEEISEAADPRKTEQESSSQQRRWRSATPHVKKRRIPGIDEETRLQVEKEIKMVIESLEKWLKVVMKKEWMKHQDLHGTEY
ncbi:CRE-USP-33 protein [Caenorhabditis remanei]|uniref:Ubiquitin carboxyl-terminal hydrolase n=1 Tax=Caenorhabditis remanei TaxID=31234 RepID=E3MCH5_CAERE|nr:CRE-USP-33 protein [Caenorhabditis remanei]